jgi:hypothetical protein
LSSQASEIVSVFLSTLDTPPIGQQLALHTEDGLKVCKRLFVMNTC